LKRRIIFLVIAAILCQSYCAYAQDLKVEDGKDAFRSPWDCVNEHYAKSRVDIREEHQKSREAALKSELALLWNIVPGMMYYRMFRKTFMDKEQETP
jgi:hypothetical protein